MHTAVPNMFLRRASLADAERIFAIYSQSPSYFDIISIPLPTLEEVKRELEAAAHDPKRHTELMVTKEDDLEGCERVVGYLDYKLDYPEAGDATVNLLLIPENLQNRGYGRLCIGELETKLKGRAKRVLASIYGRNPRAEGFWRSLGYTFAIDAKPVLDWYAKELD